MKKLISAIVLTIGAVATTQACEIEGHAKWCVEVVKLQDTTQQIFIDGKPSADFSFTPMYGSYLKITYNKPITQNLKGELIVKSKDGKEVKRPMSVTTKLLDDGSKVQSGMAGFLNQLKAGK